MMLGCDDYVYKSYPLAMWCARVMSYMPTQEDSMLIVIGDRKSVV